MRTSRAFTLIELLVTVSIIVLLASMLLPALKLVMEQAKVAKCTSNLRQIFVAVQVYGQDNDGLVVRSAYTANPGAPTHFWHGYLGDYVDASNTGSDSIYDLRQKNTVLWGCPEYVINPATPWYTGYGFNCWLREPQKDPGWRMYTNAWLGTDWSGNWNMGVFSEFSWSAIRGTSVRPLMADRDDDWSIYYGAGLPNRRHHQRSNIVYCDGHTGRLEATEVRSIVQDPR